LAKEATRLFEASTLPGVPSGVPSMCSTSGGTRNPRWIRTGLGCHEGSLHVGFDVTGSFKEVSINAPGCQLWRADPEHSTDTIGLSVLCMETARGWIHGDFS